MGDALPMYARMLGIGGSPMDLKIETQNRLYDFTVTVLDGTARREVHIELKVDASLVVLHRKEKTG
jgi:hypothetical protein